MSTRARSHRKSVRISADIKRQIAFGRLTAGEKLPSEREMAQRYRVSRVSVREAYKSLEELGVVIVRRGAEGGAFIAAPGQEVMQNSLALMLRLGGTSAAEINDAWMIQPAIAQLAARHARRIDIARLKRLLAREEAAMAAHRRPPHPSTFQRALVHCARNQPLAALINCLADITMKSMPEPDVLQGMSQQIHRFHRSIVDAIARRDETAADRVTREYVQTILRRTVVSGVPKGGGGLPVGAYGRNSGKAA